MPQRPEQGADKTILIVDDDVAYCAAMGEILDSAGFRTLSANSVNEALWVLTDTTPDVILSDTMMPLTDGASLLRILRKVDRFRDIPIVTVSARAMPSDRAEAFAAGAERFFGQTLSGSVSLGRAER